ncbi:MAG: excalibur calcium-binding domain-containing protein [Rhodobacter sp.]|nr:excalibur calcium-binding domain-containing protein [Paracoccaceae bacterium]MCC0076904.1 excalibur calcium-binding domain-containing protein [Rhodobacter sp.]
MRVLPLVFFLVGFLSAGCSFQRPAGDGPNSSEQMEANDSVTATTVAYERFSSMNSRQLCAVYLDRGTAAEERAIAELLLMNADQLRCGQLDIGPPAVTRRRTFSRSLIRRVGLGESDWNCSDFSSAAAAQSFFVSNGGPAIDRYDLDRDGDGYACEWGRTVQTHVQRRRAAAIAARNSRTRSVPSLSTGGRCHWVNGYTRRNGTYVRGHRRCR